MAWFNDVMSHEAHFDALSNNLDDRRSLLHNENHMMSLAHKVGASIVNLEGSCVNSLAIIFYYYFKSSCLPEDNTGFPKKQKDGEH
jgi:hypothetical protein